jgi:hypothetical protein
MMGAAEVVEEVVAACAHPSTARQGAGLSGRGHRIRSNVGTAGTAEGRGCSRCGGGCGGSRGARWEQGGNAWAEAPGRSGG